MSGSPLLQHVSLGAEICLPGWGGGWYILSLKNGDELCEHLVVVGIK